MDFIESNRKDLPPSWASYFRHPLVVLIIGIFLYTLNLKIADLMKQDSSVNFHGWSVPIVVLSCVVLALMAGWLFYSTHYAGREDDWRFERCVRWYLIQQQNESMDTI
ncbi:MAG: hypothetical protein WBD81_21685 [Collimonas pratensis]|uniref:hypothetical protein n=1 Tax=Collimonas pratensis TaxID=279113 RepID=UPI003C72F55F